MRIFKSLSLAMGLFLASMAGTMPAPAATAVTETELAPLPQEEPVRGPGEAGPQVEGVEADVPLAAEARDAAFDYAEPVESVGQPDGRMGIQEQFTPVGHEARWFHDAILMPIITAISLLVLALLLWVVVRYNRRANPTPSRTTHNTALEVIWTLVPVLLLVGIAVPSISLIARQYDLPQGETVTVKITGNQWYWTYEYPDHGDITLISNMLVEESDANEGQRFRTDEDGPRLLAVDERMVIPAGVNVRFLVTASDVIHSFAVPAFWTKIDAVPGRLNEGWVRVERPGVYYGQCSELCGVRHAFMPIAVEVVTPAQFAAWVRSKGGTMPGDEPAGVGDDTDTPIGEDAEAPVQTDTVDTAAEAEMIDESAVVN